MCGIFALVQPPNQPVDVGEIKCACSLMQHRGPDQAGYALLNNGTVGFGHNRLSIQDPSAPPQPLVDQSTGTTIIYNGEVYDHINVGRGLKKDYGIVLPESTDTAVILALYLLLGPTPEFFCRLNGEFAFVIWDAQRHKLIAARDRFGVKPLFWYYDSARLVFASEIKAILSVKGVKRKFSTEWLDHISVLLTFPSHTTFAEGIFSLSPGKYLTMDLTNGQWDPPKFDTYWSILPLLHMPNLPVTYEEAKAEVRRLLTASVQRRLVADREMCVYLSGGVDSTVICGIASMLGHPLTALTICFGDHQLSEEDVAVKTAQHYSVPHRKLIFTSEDAARLARKTIYHTEIPIINPHSVAKFCLSEFAHNQKFVVSLTGEGSDELLLGYPPFRMDTLLEMRTRGGASAIKAEKLVQGFLKREGSGDPRVLLLGLLSNDTPRVRGTPSWNAAHEVRLCIATDALRAPYQDGHSLPPRSLDNYAPVKADGLSGVRLGQLWWFNTLQKYIIPCLGDRVEMGSSMEGRPPMLDPKFAEFVLRLPEHYMVDPDTLREKKVLYDAFKDMLPPHVYARTKQPFFAPPWYDALFKTDAGEELRNKYLSREALERVGHWSPERFENMITELRKGDAQLDSFLGLIMSMQIMHDIFIENPIAGDPEFAMVDKTPRRP